MEKPTALQIEHRESGVESSGSTDQNTHLSPKETRQIVTPYAFFVADDLLGTPLAGPFRRGFGLLIDLIFVGLLTQVSSLILAAIAAWTFFRAGNRLKTKKRFNAVRMFLRLLVAILLFVVAMGIVDKINDDNASDFDPPEASVTINNEVDAMELVALTAKYLLVTKAINHQIAQGECEPAYDCLQNVGKKLIKEVVDIGLNRNATDGALARYLESVSKSLSTQQQTELTQHLQQLVDTQYPSTSREEQTPIPSDNNDSENDTSEKNTSYTDSKNFTSWLANLTDELGIGFGWAAFYFSVFTAWWKGQTPGKKLLGMKVIKLDNTPLSLWESLGRYGGYAAGFATGLTGFLQVFWDPNRQAIQDKISETLVIDLRKPKVSFVKEMAE